MKNALIVQSGGMTPVINASLIGIVNAGEKAFNQIYGAKYGIHGLFLFDFVELSSFSKEYRERIARTPSGFLGSSRIKLSEDKSKEVVELLRQENIGCLFLIGGNDTAYNAKVLSEASREMRYDLQVIGIPKTIDNDLPHMYFCPGYPSVARYVAICVQEAGLDTRAMRHSDPVKIIEVMGRNAGWIVAASGVLKEKASQPPHLLCPPERLIDYDWFIERVRRIYEEFGFVVVVVSETVKDTTGRRVAEKQKGIVADQFGHGYVESASQVLANMVEERLNIRARWERPGSFQRMSVCHRSELDFDVAYDAGMYAVDLAKGGLSGVEVQIKKDGFSYIELDEIALNERHLPKDFISEDGSGITQKCRDYIVGLIGDDLPDYSWLY